MSSASSSLRRPTSIIRFEDDHHVIRMGEPIENSQKQSSYEYAYEVTGDVYDPSSLKVNEQIRIPVTRLLAPVDVKMIMCIGLNYVEHSKECNMTVPKHPVLFVKNINAVTGSGNGNPVLCPAIACSPAQLDYEGELVAVIGKPCLNVTPEKALDYVLGYTVANDVSARQWQLNPELAGGMPQWNRGKGFDTFCPIGPRLVFSEFIPDVQNLAIETRVNGETMQKDTTKSMLFSVAQLVAFLSQGTTLAPGTIILTGTPEGIGHSRNPPKYLQHGDIVTVTVESIGTLTNEIKYLA